MKSSKNISKKVKTKCFTYNVTFVPENESLRGITEPNDLIIKINSKMPLELQKETLFHELMHVSVDDCALFDKFDDDLEEKLIRHSSPNLVQIFQDNPWLTDFIFNKESILKE